MEKEPTAHKMEFMNRGTKAGFTEYFSNRQAHFQDIFDREYTPEAAAEEFDNIKKMKWCTQQEEFI
ncbi:MAG: hypothetical protein WC401_09630 [Bacteroidales bacterium]